MDTFNHPRHGRGRDHTHPGGPLRPTFSHEDSRGAKPDYKTAALCKHVRRTLALTLSGECADPVLQDLIVNDVLPAPNAGRLLVTLLLRDRDGASGPTVIDVLQRLANVHGLLRARIAQSITRKRTPELAFDVILIAPPNPDPFTPSADPLMRHDVTDNPDTAVPHD